MQLTINDLVRDIDFDGRGPYDENGDGAPDDNCEGMVNPDQADQDGDGVGDVCDVCPDVFDPLQTNLDGAGRGDACNDNGDTACPFLHLYAVDSCSVDEDGDEIEITIDGFAPTNSCFVTHKLRRYSSKWIKLPLCRESRTA